MNNDLISRQDAIDLLRKRLIETANNNVGFKCDAGQVFEDASERIRYWIDELPSAQPEKRTEKRTETHACDCISREWLKIAIHNFYYGLNHIPTEEDIQAYIDAAPSAQPEIVRCEDCAYGEKLPDNIRCELHDYLPFGYKDFCSMGVERVTGR